MEGKTLKTILDQNTLSSILRGLSEYVRFFIDGIPSKGLSKRGMTMPISSAQYDEIYEYQKTT